ncbi:hypothetical protein FJY93_03315 [Candidatus Kaiserbacteria bacterium]|nr:hypothetical protein [Candidatus Kaiserbacteria bacterium]
MKILITLWCVILFGISCAPALAGETKMQIDQHEQYPYIVDVSFGRKGRIEDGGSAIVVHPRILLMAAHEFFDEKGRKISLKEIRVVHNGTHTYRAEVDRVYMHPEIEAYLRKGTGDQDIPFRKASDDLAVVVLTSSIDGVPLAHTMLEKESLDYLASVDSTLGNKAPPPDDLKGFATKEWQAVIEKVMLDPAKPVTIRTVGFGVICMSGGKRCDDRKRRIRAAMLRRWKSCDTSRHLAPTKVWCVRGFIAPGDSGGAVIADMPSGTHTVIGIIAISRPPFSGRKLVWSDASAASVFDANDLLKKARAREAVLPPKTAQELKEEPPPKKVRKRNNR